MTGALAAHIAAAAMLAVAAAACGGGGEGGEGPLVERGQPEARRSGEEVAAEATSRASRPTPSPAGEPAAPRTPSPAPPTPTRAATAAPSPTAPAGPTPAAPRIPTGDEYDPDLNMYLYLSGGGHRAELTVQALAAAVENADRSQVPVIIEGMRFLGSTSLAELSTIALSELTGENLGLGIGSWHGWMEWYGRRAADFPPPDGYVDWKVHVLSQIDPAFAQLLMPWALTGRIDPTEIVWGGVQKDGIPDLRDPPLVSPEEAAGAYIRPGDRVFGVSINGEHRAYPLRIVNAHEMANDVLGGEPISLAY